MASTDDEAFGTALHDAPVTRADFERAIRSLNISDLELRDALLNVAARVVALTDELTRRLDGVEPLPAAPNTPADKPTATLEATVAASLDLTLATLRAADARTPTRVSLDLGGDKYATASPPIPCDELIPLCGARCCMLSFPLSTQDLDEAVIRWDYGQPYLIRQRSSDGFCVHNDPTSHGCTVHHYRPRVCRAYDCRNDDRVWLDYAQRIPAPLRRGTFDDKAPAKPGFDLVARARARSAAIARETTAISQTFADEEPTRGPKPGTEPT